MSKYTKLKIYSDGGSRGNPGPSAIGVVIKDDKNNVIKTYSEYLGENMTNNQAEYSAVVLAMSKVKLFSTRNSNIEFYLDSELVVNQLSQRYKVKDKKLALLFVKIWNLTMDFKSVKFFHIPREENEQADELVNEALDNRA